MAPQSPGTGRRVGCGVNGSGARPKACSGIANAAANRRSTTMSVSGASPRS